jgi:hypothetical protein
MVGGEAGFQDVILVMFGFDPEAGRVLGMRMLESKETPGLGDKIFKDEAFVAQFDVAEVPMIPIKPGGPGRVTRGRWKPSRAPRSPRGP